MGRDRKRGKSNKGWKSPSQGSHSNTKKKRRQGWSDDLEFEFQFYNNGGKAKLENASQRRHSLPAALNEKASPFRKFNGSPVASLRNPKPVYGRKQTAPRAHNTYAYDYSSIKVEEHIRTLQNDDVEDLTRAYVKMKVNQDDASSASDSSSELLGSESDGSSSLEENSDIEEFDYNDLLAYEDSSGEGGSSDFDDLESDDDEHESEDDDEGEDMDTEEEAQQQEAQEVEEQHQEEIEGNPGFFIDKTADITILASLELSQSRDDVLKTPEILRTSAKMKRPKSTSDKIKIAKNKRTQPIVVHAPSDSRSRTRVKAKVMRNIGELEKWFSDGNGSSEGAVDSDEEFDKEAILDYMQNISPTHKDFLTSRSFEIYNDYDSPDENITQSQLNIPRRAIERVDRQDKRKKSKRETKERKPVKMMRGPRSEKKGRKQLGGTRYSKPQSWVQGQSLQDIVEEELKEFAEAITDNNNNTTTIVDVTIAVDTVQSIPQGRERSRKSERKEKEKRKGKGRRDGFDSKKLNHINDNILVLVDTDSLKELPLEPMNRTERLQVLKLAACYNVKGISKGSGKRKYLVLVKTSHTCYCDESTVKQTIKEVLSINSDPNVRAKGEKFTPTKPAPLQKGRIVGEHAEPIDASNLGNRLLRSMGWSGGGLGANGQGIATPVVATIKKDKRGLGF